MCCSASAGPRSVGRVEKRGNICVFFPISEKIFALVYLVMSWVTVKVPKAPEPLACIRRSGITSRSKCAIFSRNQMFWSNAGPRSPAVAMFWLSSTGAPNAVVSFLSILPSLWCFRLLCWSRNSASPFFGLRPKLIGRIRNCEVSSKLELRKKVAVEKKLELRKLVQREMFLYRWDGYRLALLQVVQLRPAKRHKFRRTEGQDTWHQAISVERRDRSRRRQDFLSTTPNCV